MCLVYIHIIACLACKKITKRVNEGEGKPEPAAAISPSLAPMTVTYAQQQQNSFRFCFISLCINSISFRFGQANEEEEEEELGPKRWNKNKKWHAIVPPLVTSQPAGEWNLLFLFLLLLLLAPLLFLLLSRYCCRCQVYVHRYLCIYMLKYVHTVGVAKIRAVGLENVHLKRLLENYVIQHFKIF